MIEGEHFLIIRCVTQSTVDIFCGVENLSFPYDNNVLVWTFSLSFHICIPWVRPNSTKTWNPTPREYGQHAQTTLYWIDNLHPQQLCTLSKYNYHRLSATDMFFFYFQMELILQLKADRKPRPGNKSSAPGWVQHYCALQMKQYYFTLTSSACLPAHAPGPDDGTGHRGAWMQEKSPTSRHVLQRHMPCQILSGTSYNQPHYFMYRENMLPIKLWHIIFLPLNQRATWPYWDRSNTS